MGHFRFAAVGDNCVDRFQAPINQSLIGGNAVNVAVQLARLGHSSFYFGAVGKDVDGERTTRALKDNGVETSCLQLRPGNTAYTNIEQTASGDRIIAYEDFGTCAGYRPSEEDIAVLKTMDHVHLGWLDDAGELRRRLSSEGVSLSQDISVNANPENLGVAGLTVAFASAGARGAPALLSACEWRRLCGRNLRERRCAGASRRGIRGILNRAGHGRGYDRRGRQLHRRISGGLRGTAAARRLPGTRPRLRGHHLHPCWWISPATAAAIASPQTATTTRRRQVIRSAAPFRFSAGSG